MKKVLFVSFLGLMISVVSVFGQKVFKVTADECPDIIIRCLEPDETGVVVQSDAPLTFESTVDKVVKICNTTEENGSYFYYLAFKVDKKFRGRILIIKGYGYQNFRHPLELQPKVSVCMKVDAGVLATKTWEEFWRKGTIYFDNTQYAEALIEYKKALICRDVGKDSVLINQKIKDAGLASDTKRRADDFFNTGKYVEALQKYEELLTLNPNAIYTKEQIQKCKKKMEDEPFTVSGTVYFEGKPMQGISIEVGYPRKRKKEDEYIYIGPVTVGERMVGKDIRKFEWTKLGVITDRNGSYKIEIKRKAQRLYFSKREETTTEIIRYSELVEVTSNDKMDITLKKVTTTKQQSTKK